MLSRLAVSSRNALRSRAPVFARAFHAGKPTFATVPAEADEDKSPIEDSFVEKYSLDHWSRALPIGFFGASWLIGGGYYVVNEETMLAISGTMFAIVLYDSASGAMNEMMDDRANEILKAQNELEDAQIAKLDELLNIYKSEKNMIEDTEQQIDDTVALCEELADLHKLKWKHSVRDLVVKHLDGLVALRTSTINSNLEGIYEKISGSVKSTIESDESFKSSAISDAIAVLNGEEPAYDDIPNLYMSAVHDHAESVYKAVESGEADLTKLSAEDRAQLQADLDGLILRDEGGKMAMELGENKLPDKVKLDLSLF